MPSVIKRGVAPIPSICYTSRFPSIRGRTTGS